MPSSKLQSIALVVFVVTYILRYSSANPYWGGSHTMYLCYISAIYLFYITMMKMKICSDNSKKNILPIIAIGLISFVPHLNEQNFSDYQERVFTMLIVPSLLALYMETSSRTDLCYLRKSLIIIYLIQCGLAIYESLTQQLLFTSDEVYTAMTTEDLTFRSSGLFYHPLSSAFVTMIMFMYIISSEINIKLKMLLVIIGFCALMAYNGRANIFVAVICGMPMLYTQIRKNKSKKIRRLGYLLLFVAVYIFCYVVFYTDYGDRLFRTFEAGGKLDDSSLARFEVLETFKYISNSEFWWGDTEAYNRLLTVMGVAGIENGFVCIILTFGVIFGTLIIYTYLRFMYSVTKASYGKFEHWMLFLSFILVGMSNPHIYAQFPWLFFVLSYYAFRPQGNLTNKKA